MSEERLFPYIITMTSFYMGEGVFKGRYELCVYQRC